jgi:uncharacterized membrane protein
MNDMIERYLYAVTSKLPEQQRMDIELELRGLIDDMLEERIESDQPTQKEIEEVLIELGNPNDLAMKYRGHNRYLIGTELFDTYLVVLKIVGYCILIGLSVVFAIEIVVSPMSVLDQFVDYLVSLIAGGAQGFAWVTGIFWLIERNGVKATVIGGSHKAIQWTPAQLPAIPNPRTKIKPIDPILGIIFTVLFMVLIAFSIDLVGVFSKVDGETVFISLFDIDVFRGFLPFLYGLLGLAILRECIKLITKQWNFKLAFFCIIFNIMSFIIALVVLHDQAIWNPHFMNELVDSGILLAGSDSFEMVQSIWSLSTERFIYIVGVIFLIDTVSVIYHTSKARG